MKRRSRLICMVYHTPEEAELVDRTLREIAKKYGYIVVSGPRAGGGSIAALLRAIAEGEFEIVEKK